MSHSQSRCILLILTHAWLSLWDKHMTTGRINQITSQGTYVPYQIKYSPYSIHINHPTFPSKSSLQYTKKLSGNLEFFVTSNHSNILSLIGGLITRHDALQPKGICTKVSQVVRICSSSIRHTSTSEIIQCHKKAGTIQNRLRRPRR